MTDVTLSTATDEEIEAEIERRRLAAAAAREEELRNSPDWGPLISLGLGTDEPITKSFSELVTALTALEAETPSAASVHHHAAILGLRGLDSAVRAQLNSVAA